MYWSTSAPPPPNKEGGTLDPKLGRHMKPVGNKYWTGISANFVGNFGKTDPY